MEPGLVSYCVPVAQLDVYDPRYLGGVTRMGWAGDFLADKADAAYPRWEHVGTEPIPEWQAFAPAGLVTRTSMSLANWEIVSGRWDDKARPSGAPRTTFLHAYSGEAGAVSKVRSRASYGPNWCAWFYRHVPPADTAATAACDFSIKMAAASGPQWRIIIPTRNSAHKWPRLMRNAADLLPMYEVSRLDADTTASQDAGWQEVIVWCEQTLNAWIITLKVNGAAHRWFCCYPGPDAADATVSLCAAGPLEVQSQGQQLMFSVAPITYPWYSQCYPRTRYAINADLATLSDVSTPPEYQALVVNPTGTDCMVEVDTDATANSLAPRLTFLASDETKRAVCGIVSVIVPPAWDANTYATAKYTTAGAATFGAGDEITYVRRSSYRGSEFSLPLRDNAGTLDIGPNYVAVLSAAYQTEDTAPTLAALATGYVVSNERDRQSPVDTEFPLRVEDFWSARMPHKSMIFMPSFARMPFGKAFRIIANRIGLPDAQIVVDASLESTVLPGPQVLGEQSLYWNETEQPEAAFDKLCACVGAFCGIQPDGKLFAKPLLTYSGTPDYTIDDDTANDDDRLLQIVHRRELGDFANNVFVVSGSEGYRQVGWARDAGSETTTTDEAFTGDQFVVVESLDQVYATAQTLATRTLATRGHFSDVLEWRPAVAKTTLAPGKFVRVQVSALAVPTNAVYYITEESGAIVPVLRDAGGWQQRFVMVRVQ